MSACGCTKSCSQLRQERATKKLMGSINTCETMGVDARRDVFLQVCDSHTGDVFQDFTQDFWHLPTPDKIRTLVEMNRFDDECIYPKFKTAFLAIYFADKVVKMGKGKGFAQLVQEKLTDFNTVCPLPQQELDEMDSYKMKDFCKNIKWC